MDNRSKEVKKKVEACRPSKKKWDQKKMMKFYKPVPKDFIFDALFNKE
jgi:hypothetical protein